MRISIFGLGYVGAVSAGCWADFGHDVTGVDPSLIKVEAINQGRSPVIEKGLESLIEKAVRSSRLRAIPDAAEAVRNSDISFICVGTPSQHNGGMDLKHIKQVSEEIGAALSDKSTEHLVVLRSTAFPGTMRDIVIPALEAGSGRRVGEGFGVCGNPEFLREGTAIHDFHHPPKTVIGELDAASGDKLAALYGDIPAPLIRTSLETAEMIKYVDNIWHALKITYANEIGSICKTLGLDGQEVMNIFCRDEKLNISPAYLKPGFAFGGSCLPKDLRAMTHNIRRMDLDLPVINSILPSNERQIERGLDLIYSGGSKRVGILGLSFKSGTDDLRESPMVRVAEQLIGKGYDLRIYDRNVKLASIFGANRDYILNRIPHISRLMVNEIQDILDHADVIVIGNNDPEFACVRDTVQGNGRVVIDFVRAFECRSDGIAYNGICW
ncbi:MAG: nucleotide sugar dehydrogenase [Desulfobacteraceae bacterium]|nr:nucleotide sugar dehydrogenase [Desulfobacteraceae bacterium]